MKKYEDFIGQELMVTVGVFSFKSAKDALRSHLWERIKNELTYQNGLLCDFENITYFAHNKQIDIIGTVTKCEVDC